MQSDAELLFSIHKLSEAHARVLARIEDPKERIDLVKLCIKEHLCARESKLLLGDQGKPMTLRILLNGLQRIFGTILIIQNRCSQSMGKFA